MKTAEFLGLYTLEEQTEYIHHVAERFQESDLKSEDFRNLQYAYLLIRNETELIPTEETKDDLFPKYRQGPSSFSDETINTFLDAYRNGQEYASNIKRERYGKSMNEDQVYQTAHRTEVEDLTDTGTTSISEFEYYTQMNEQRDQARDSVTLMKKAARLEGVPETRQQWETLCEAKRVDAMLQDPKYPVTQTLMYDVPKDRRQNYNKAHKALEGYLEQNQLPNEYEALKQMAEQACGEALTTHQIDTSVKSIYDLPFDERVSYAAEHQVRLSPYHAVQNAMREAYLIDRMEPEQKDMYKNRLFERGYDTLHGTMPEGSDMESVSDFRQYLEEDLSTEYPRSTSYGGVGDERQWMKCNILDHNAYPLYSEARDIQEGHADLETALDGLQEEIDKGLVMF